MPRYSSLLLLTLCLALTCSCVRRPASTADVPRSLPADYTISVAPFTQPTDTSQLIVGHIPERQGRIPEGVLPELDRSFRHVLHSSGKRQLVFLKARNLPADMTRYHSSEQPQALPLWQAYGRQMGAQYLLIPQVLHWQQREGSGAGVTQSAHVRLEFFLIRTDDGTLLKRNIFEEKQVGLTDNLLTVGSFFKRKGAWVTAEELATEGMAQAVKEMGL
ncbi:MAG: hypothetical protein IJD16_10670 [Desulfovibrio sp.]|nr:hypothetical protein [Desulfovibrio sp.]